MVDNIDLNILYPNAMGHLHGTSIDDYERHYFMVGDRVRVAHGYLMLKEAGSKNCTPEKPKSCKDDPTIGLIGTITEIRLAVASTPNYYVLDRNVEGFSSENINTVCEMDVEFDKDILIQTISKKTWTFEWTQLVNYTYLGEEKAAKLYKETRDRDLFSLDTLDPNEYISYKELFNEFVEICMLYRIKALQAHCESLKKSSDK